MRRAGHLKNCRNKNAYKNIQKLNGWKNAKNKLTGEYRGRAENASAMGGGDMRLRSVLWKKREDFIVCGAKHYDDDYDDYTSYVSNANSMTQHAVWTLCNRFVTSLGIPASLWCGNRKLDSYCTLMMSPTCCTLCAWTLHKTRKVKIIINFYA